MAVVDTPSRTRVAILGCTGSIGTQALDVCKQHSDKLEVVALSAHSRTENLVHFAHEFAVRHVAVTSEAHRGDAVLSELPSACELHTGSRCAEELVELEDVDVVLVAIVGAAGLSASHAVLKSGKRLALANKESLVVGGDLLMPMVQPGQMLPVDSEHGAIFQCLLGENPREAHCIWLTCSGGPFYGRTLDELSDVTRHDALAHPTWNMGAKITIDSATLMNKGLERIEAMHLFGMDIDRIKVLIQRESNLMVDIMAHSVARPIQYAFSYPERWSTPAPRVDFREIAQLTFGAPDMESFRCLKLAEIAGKQGGTLPCVLNAANEVAVDAFLHDACTFTGIADVVEACMDEHDCQKVVSFEQLADVDAWAREQARGIISSRF
ncbi:MAG: 1-deoxy-D-xylulose-5-phosphate reductoisomerase [Coriobacteriaceae bacterium]